MGTMGFWTELGGIQLDDSEDGSWIQIMPYGTWEHPVYGSITADDGLFDDMVENFEANVRGQELDVDYDHKAQDGKAAGWFKGLQKRTEGLFARVAFTSPAKEAVQNKEYRYFSPEFADEWENPVDKKTYKNVLFGGAITNRPFLKGILPINLSELVISPQSSTNTPKGGNQNVDKLTKLLTEKLGLADDVSEDKLIEAVTAKLEAPPPEPKTDDEIKKLSEDHPAIAKMLAEQEQTRKELAELRTRHRMTEIERDVSKLNEVEASRKYPPAITEKMPKLLSEMRSEQAAEVLELMEEIVKVGFVTTGERGRATTGSGESVNNIKAFTEAVDAKVKENPQMSWADAASAVSAANPKLWESYNEALMEGAR